jgi:predicted nucleic acid-binding protein
MPIIVDTNCLANVFCRSSHKHRQFEPVLEWIVAGKGKLVYGGTKYKKELAKAGKYLKIFRQLKDAGKAVVGNDNVIDSIEKDIENKRATYKFNDSHLLAISVNTKCRLICSEDSASIQYVTSKNYLPKGAQKPVYYTSNKNVNLLSDKYIHKDLKPLCRINQKLATIIYNQLP